MQYIELDFGLRMVLWKPRGNSPKVLLVEGESIIYRNRRAFQHWDSLWCLLYLGTEGNRPRHLRSTAMRKGHGCLVCI